MNYIAEAVPLICHGLASSKLFGGKIANENAEINVAKCRMNDNLKFYYTENAF